MDDLYLAENMTYNNSIKDMMQESSNHKGKNPLENFFCNMLENDASYSNENESEDEEFDEVEVVIDWAGELTCSLEEL